MNGDHRAMPADEMMVRGLMRKGWAEGPARQYLAEKALCRRSRSGSPGMAVPGASEGLNSKLQATVFHVADLTNRSLEADANLLDYPPKTGRDENV